MSKRKNNPYEKNPLQMVLYIAAVAVLCALLVFLVYRSRQRSREYEQMVQKAAVGETEYVWPERTETESETETESAATEAPETETASEAAKQQNVLVLNGTKKEGVAAYWEKELRAEGFEQVYTASYTKPVEAKTVIYADKIADAAPLRSIFTGSIVRIGEITEGIELTAQTELPEQVDVYIIVGSDDARSE